jgi:hypothetical protein
VLVLARAAAEQPIAHAWLMAVCGSQRVRTADPHLSSRATASQSPRGRVTLGAKDQAPPAAAGSNTSTDPSVSE